MITSYQLPFGKSFIIKFKKKNEKFNMEEGSSITVEIDKFKIGEWGQVYSTPSQPSFHSHIKSKEDFDERFEITDFESHGKMYKFGDYEGVIAQHKRGLK